MGSSRIWPFTLLIFIHLISISSGEDIFFVVHAVTTKYILLFPCLNINNIKYFYPFSICEYNVIAWLIITVLKFNCFCLVAGCPFNVHTYNYFHAE